VLERRAVLAGAKYPPTTESELSEDIAKARLIVAGIRETIAAGNDSCPRAGLLLIKMSEALAGRLSGAYVDSEEVDLYLRMGNGIGGAGRPRERRGRPLAEYRSVCGCETSEIPKAEFGRDPGNGGLCRIGQH
jgi:hypothetical protein